MNSSGALDFLQSDHVPELAPSADWVATATYNRYCALEDTVRAMRIRDKRKIYQILRNYQQYGSQSFLPHYGLTFGEFSTFQILTENTRKRR